MQRSYELSRRDYDAVIFDLDGVITDTASVHRRAWKEVFDEVLRRRLGDDVRPFGPDDYTRYVDGKPRFDGIRSFLESRQIELPEDSDDDCSGLETVAGIGREKNRRYRRRLADGEAVVFDDSVTLVRRLAEAGFGIGLVSSSRNAGFVVELLGIDQLFEVRVDGQTLAEKDMAGKPAPEMFVEAARRLGAKPKRAVVVEDAESGVEAGRAGGFGLVIGLSDDADRRRTLLERGADVAVESLARFSVVS